MRHRLAKHIFACTIILCMCFSMSFPILAADDSVDSEQDLLDAIADAPEGAVIEIEANIVLSNKTITIDKDIVIQSAEAGPYTLKQANSGIRHFTVTATGKLTLKDIVLSGGEQGGGIQSSGTLTLGEDVVVKECKSSGYGGAVYIAGGTFTMEGSTLTENEAAYGGAVCIWEGEFVLEAGEITNNISYHGGGGIIVYDSFIMKGGLIDGNEANTNGGGLSVIEGTAELQRGTFSNNTAVKRGGAIFNDEKATVTVHNLLVTENEAEDSGVVDPIDPLVAAGGGLWVCPTGEVALGEYMEMAVYDNVAPQGFGQDIHLQARKQPATFYLPEIALGGGMVGWYYEEETRYAAGLFNWTNTLSFTAGLSSGDKSKAENAAKVIVTDNKATCGGGLAINGVIKFEEKIDLVVTKYWTGGEGPKERPQSITIYLVINGEKQEDTYITLTAESGATGVFKDLPFTDEFGIPIVYSIQEIVPLGFTVEYGELRINEKMQYEISITNTLVLVTDLMVKKVWEVEPESEVPDVLVYLVKDGVKQNTFIKLDESNGWQGAFTNLDIMDGTRKIVYSIVEEVPDHFSVAYSELRVNEDGKYEITITNTRTIDLMVEKIWQVETEEEIPEFVLVYLVINGVKQDVYIRLDESNGWKGAFTGLTIKNSAGTIVYSVEEAVPEYFEASYSELRVTEDGQYQIIITNTRETEILPDERPETGDSLSIWLAFLGLSTLGLCAAGFYGYKQKKTISG